MLGVFIAWKRLSRRTEDLSRELGLELLFIRDRLPYFKAFVNTATILREKKPRVVFIQLPQGPLLAEVVMFSRLLKLSVVADVHTGFIYPTAFKEVLLNKPFHSYLRFVRLVVAHNILERELIVRKAGVLFEKSLVVYDPLPKPPQRLSKLAIEVDVENAISLPASWSSDEPLDKVVEEFSKSRTSRELALIITGSWKRNRELYNKVNKVVGKLGKEKRVILTGFIPDEEYWYLLKSCRAVIALTNREYTLPHAMWESVAVRKPFITARTRAIELELGSSYPCVFKPDLSDFAQALDKCLVEGESGRAVDAVENLALKSKQSIEKLRRVIQSLA
uniref:Glycosyltransferase family 1 protein n=1 Tax=Ignisphaera aggregans TaxID=334771 RepID=A0A7C4FI15_9CREN